MTFQDIILALQSYWAARGCAIVQPWDVEKGAGTFNAATYLRALGPEPWAVAYVEPSRRPTDGRYGENPNRLERHHQFQVLIKASPKAIQEMYLGSLRALGIDPFEHDLRFVEDNWESPTLGAWGLGWEVWCDGMEVTQFTYFQQCGGYDLQPISVELTYGLERLAMALQNVDNVYDLKWVGELTYGMMRHPDEVQWSKHNFEAADIGLHLRWFEELKTECLRLCDLGLVIPAYDYCLRCSHVFNILDARGAIGVTERQAYILRVRELAKRCADAFLEHRQSLGFPLLATARTDAMPVVDVQPVPEPKAATAPLLLEIGTEEIPARLAPNAAKGLFELVQAQLAEWGLEGVAGPHADSTPRRLAIGFDSVPTRQADRTEVLKGPPVKVAYDAAGALTKAGQAFHDRLLPGDELYREDTGKGEYVMARRRMLGRPVAALLAEALPTLLGKLHWPKPMRWGREPQPFVRPIHWIVAAFGGENVPFLFAGVQSGVESRGHRFHAPASFRATTWQELEAGLGERKVTLSSTARKSAIRNEVQRIATTAGGRPVEDEALLEEVTNLVEWPVPLLGSFEPELLNLPRQAIVTPMRVHQRYFPIERADGSLLPNFVVVAGTEVKDPHVVQHGNARVLRARLADARYFFENDLKKPLESFLPRLETRIWLAQVGSVRQKVDRLVELVTAMGGDNHATRATQLCKADLASEMVGEFPELQGEMGREYAGRQGEPDEVAQGIYESYLPRFAGDALPSTRAGTYAALADRIDSIVGCFGVGLKPTGSKDPYALRRQALGVINILATTEHGVPLDLGTWVDASLTVYGSIVDAKVRGEILAFFAERTRFLLRERLPTDVVDAVVAVGATRPRDVFGKIEALVGLRERGELEPILTTFKRVANISKGVMGFTGMSEYPISDPAEGDLVYRFPSGAVTLVERGDFEGAVREMAALRPFVDRFFDEVLVMHENPTLRDARLTLLASIRRIFGGIADFSRIQDRK